MRADSFLWFSSFSLPSRTADAIAAPATAPATFPRLTPPLFPLPSLSSSSFLLSVFFPKKLHPPVGGLTLLSVRLEGVLESLSSGGFLPSLPGKMIVAPLSP
ncbi:hypothetical protein TWF696_008832 [Orbilia brochopaga]|uniref:Secreted protein n=1 Tax=Orbilia brochopaga TaxID=3140254 RepID=A0AAV9UEB5_9PEZI